jgi:hypothetical protein
MRTLFVTALLFISPLLWSSGNAWAECTSKGPHDRQGCGGCRLDAIKKDPNWFAFYENVKSHGISPLSCYRTRGCQQNLVLSCGGGRAATGISNHESRIAMDFSTHDGQHETAKRLAKKILTGSVRGLKHDGGGYHMSNGVQEGKPLQTSSDVDEYRAKRRAGSSGSNSGYVERPGKNGTWLRRRSGEWVRMTWDPIR